MFLEQRLRRVCRLRDLYVGRVYLWVASAGLGDVVDQPQSVVQPESACNDRFLVRSVSERIGVLGNARSGTEMCIDGAGKFFFLVEVKLLFLSCCWIVVFELLLLASGETFVGAVLGLVAAPLRLALLLLPN